MLREVWLEVLVQNDKIRLYEKLGFVGAAARRWALDGLVFQKHKVRSVAAAAAQERIRAERTWREPWQRADESVANYDDVDALDEHSAILFRRAGDRVWLLQGSSGRGGRTRDLAVAPARQPRSPGSTARGRPVQRRDRLTRRAGSASPTRAAAVALVDLVGM